MKDPNFIRFGVRCVASKEPMAIRDAMSLSKLFKPDLCYHTDSSSVREIS